MLTRAGGKTLEAIRKVLEEANQDDKPWQASPKEKEGLALLGCPEAGGPMTLVQKTTLGAAKNLQTREGEGRDWTDVWIDDEKEWRRVTTEDLRAIVWSAARAEAAKTQIVGPGGTAAEDLGRQAAAEVSKFIDSHSEGGKKGGEVNKHAGIPNRTIRTIAAITHTTRAINGGPLFGGLLHIPWQNTDQGITDEDHPDTQFGAIPADKSLTRENNWEGESVLAVKGSDRKRSSTRSRGLMLTGEVMEKIVNNASRPTRISRIYGRAEALPTGGKHIVTIKVEGKITHRVVVFENKSAQTTRPMGRKAAMRACTRHNEGNQSGDDPVMEIEENKGEQTEEEEGADVPSGRCAPRSQGFGLAKAMYEALDQDLDRGEGEEDGRGVCDFTHGEGSLANLGLFTEACWEMVKKAKIKVNDKLREKMMCAILRAKARIILGKQMRRSYKVWDDMG
jgi:hypothetical protein